MERQSQKPQLRWRRKEGMRLGRNSVLFLKILKVFREIRIWDLDTDDNGTISLLTSRGFDSNDSIECVTASLKRGWE